DCGLAAAVDGGTPDEIEVRIVRDVIAEDRRTRLDGPVGEPPGRQHDVGTFPDDAGEKCRPRTGPGFRLEQVVLEQGDPGDAERGVLRGDAAGFLEKLPTVLHPHDGRTDAAEDGLYALQAQYP